MIVASLEDLYGKKNYYKYHTSMSLYTICLLSLQSIIYDGSSPHTWLQGIVGYEIEQ